MPFLRPSLFREMPAWGRGWLRGDFLALGVEALLLALGVAFIYCSGAEVGGDLAGKWLRQLAWIALGVVVYGVMASVDYHFWCRKSAWGYAFAVGLLVLVLAVGHTLNNTRGWLPVPGVGYLQPVELAKPLTLLLMAWLGTRPALRNSRWGEWLPVFVLSLVAALPVGLICLQPDMGTALVFLPATLTAIFLSGLRKRWFFLGGCLLLLAVPLAFPRLNPYQKDRVKVFLAAPARGLSNACAPLLPEKTGRRLQDRVEEFLAAEEGRGPRDDWNAVQSMLAVGSGGIWGKGFLQGTQHVLGYLPKTIAPTDFIFSVIAEETGFLGGGTVILLFAVLLLCFFRTAITARDRLGCVLATGAGVIFATHIVVNLAMTMGAAPIVGIPLPFVSYGGSFMLGTMMLAGLVQSVQLHGEPTVEERLRLASEGFDEEE